MALSQDFEARRRERLKQQRRQRERMRMLKLALSAILLILIIVIAIVGITRCSKNKNTAVGTGAEQATIQPDSSMLATQQPIKTATYGAGIPAPAVGSNDLIDVITQSGEKLHAYLTFDDGPNDSITPQILDTLRKYNIKATFFMTGNSITHAPYMCTRVMEEGHLAAVHSFTHEYSTVYANETDFMDEVQRTYELICENSPNGEQPFKLFRFPGGGFNDANYGPEKQQYKEALANAGFYYCDWNALNGDAEGGAKNADELLEYFNTYRPEGKNLIILMHDSETKQETANMLASMIEELLNEGYTFHRLDEIDFTNTSNVSGTSSSASAITGETSGSLSDTSDTSSDTSYDDSDESYSDDTVSSDDSSNSSSSQSSSSSTGTASHSSSVNSTGTQGSATSSGSSSSSKSSSSTSTYSSSESDGNSSVNVYSGSSQHSSSDSDESDTDDSSSNSAYTNDDESSNHDTSSNDESNNSSSNNTLEAE